MDHLLRTLAAVPPGARVLTIDDREGLATERLGQLGFDVFAQASGPAEHLSRALERVFGSEDTDHRLLRGALRDVADSAEPFDWVALFADTSVSPEALQTAGDQLKIGGWVWVGARGILPEALDALAATAGLALAERADRDEQLGPDGVRGIYRRVDETVRS